MENPPNAPARSKKRKKKKKVTRAEVEKKKRKAQAMEASTKQTPAKKHKSIPTATPSPLVFSPGAPLELCTQEGEGVCR